MHDTQMWRRTRCNYKIPKLSLEFGFGYHLKGEPVLAQLRNEVGLGEGSSGRKESATETKKNF